MTPDCTLRDFRFDLREISGACGDLGTLLPLMLGAIAVAGLAPVPIVLGFALFYIGTALAYRLPIPVQPMKAVTAVLLATGLSPATIAASGVIMGLVLLLLGLTGWIDRLGRLVPQSVLAGLQLGLGLALGLVSLDLMAEAPFFALAMTLGLAALLIVPRLPAALLALAAATAAGQMVGLPGFPVFPSGGTPPALVGLPTWPELEQSLRLLVLPQLSLTLTNAILLTSLVAGDCYGARSSHVTPRRVALSTAIANLLLPPFGALPMCHGAGGVAAHHRFGARTGGAPLMLGLSLLGLAILPGGAGLALLAAVPLAALGALLLIASAELAFSRRLVDCRPSCWPVIAVTAAVTLILDPFWGLAVGSLAEAARSAAVRFIRNLSSS